VKFPGLLIFAVVSIASAQSDGTVLDAIKLLPRDAAKRLARIEAREGAPVPERWYLLVHDPAEERGVREYVVADGKLAGSRTLSQFAEVLKPGDAFGADAVKIDSPHVARLAAAYAEANGGRVASLNYELARDTATGAPVWKATVLDAAGDQLGVLVVTAAKGAVLSSAGFEKMPAADMLPAPAVAVETPRAASVQRKRATPTPSPKPSLLKRIFGNSEKRPKSDQ
jgi:hypothetical protein